MTKARLSIKQHAHSAGRRAAHDGVPRGDCPFPPHRWTAVQRQAWFESYDQVMQDKAARQK